MITRNAIFFIISLSATLLLVYSKILGYGFTYLDDQVQVVQNSSIQSLSFGNLKAIFSSSSVGMYQPFTTLIYAMVYQFFGLKGFGFHLASLMVHLANCVLVFKALSFFFNTSTPLSETKKNTLLLLTSIFAFHPLQVESIAWVSAFSNLVYTSFYLLAFIFYLKFIAASKTDGKQNSYWLSLLFFAFSCLSKSAAITLPVILLAVDLYHHQSFRKINWKNKIPFFLLSIFFGILTLNFRESVGHLSDLSIQFDLVQRMFLISHSVLFYLLKFIFPIQLSVFYPYPELVDGVLPSTYYLSLPILVFLGFLVWKCRVKAKLWLGALFFLISISLVLQFIPVGNQITTDRYLYLPMLGLAIVLGSVLSKAADKKWFPILFLIPLLFAFKSRERLKIWENDELIWESVIESHPKVAQAYNNLGSYVLKQGNTDRAFKLFNEAIRFKPYYADAYSNRGNLFAQKGDSKAAIKDYTQAIELKPHADAYFNRGNEFSKLNDLNTAIEDYTSSISISKSADALTNRAFAYLKQSQIQKAEADLQMAIQLFPSYDRAYFLMGLLYQQSKQPNKACQSFYQAMNLGNQQAKGMYVQNCTKQ